MINHKDPVIQQPVTVSIEVSIEGLVLYTGIQLF